MKSLNDMTKEEQQSPELFRKFEEIDLENEISEDDARGLGSSAEEISKSWMSPYYRLAKRLGIEGPYYDPNTGRLLQPKFEQLNELARNWLESEVIPAFDPELSSLFNSLSYSIHWDQLGAMVNDLLLEGETVSKVNESISRYLRLWARHVWAWEHFVYDKVAELGFKDIGQQEQIIAAAFPEKDKYVSIDDLLADTGARFKALSETSNATTIKHPNAVIVPAPRSLGYLVHSSENEAVNKFFAYGWYDNEQAKVYPIRATRSGGKYLKKTHVTITPFFKSQPPVLANLVYFHAVEIGRLHRLDSDNKDDPFGPHYFTAESVVRALTGTRKNGADLRGLEIYQEVVDTLVWLKENRHTFDGRHFVDTRCKDQNRQRLYVKDPILNWRIDPEARIDGSLTEVYIFDRIPPMFWMTDELARLRRIKSARFMPEGPSAPRRNGSFLALFDAAFEPICRQAYFIANGMTEERTVPVYLHDDLAKNRTGVFSSAGMPRPEDCTPKAYESNRTKLTKILDHLEKIGLLTYKPITEGRKIIGYMLTIKNERLIFGTEEERKEAQKVLDKPIPKKG